MEVKRLAVCGCSWSALSPLQEFKGTHWSEVLAKSFNAKLFNLALGGSSNNAIRLQIDKAIEFKPDLIIITPSYFDRIEYPIGYKPYNPSNGIKNIDRPNKPKFNAKATMRSSTLNQLVFDRKVDFAVNYFKNLYIPFWKRQLDQWIIRDGIHQIKLNNIPFLMQSQLLWEDDAEAVKFFSNIATEKNFIYKTDSIFYNMFTPQGPIDPGYHTAPITQKEFAIRLQTLIKDSNINL